MRPFERFWFNLHRHNTRLRKDRQLHHIERTLYFWPMWIYVRWAGRRLKPEQTIEPATAGFLMPENSQEEQPWQ